MVFMPAPYPMDFRREAVALLKSSGKSVPQLAAELGISPQSLRNWSRQINVDEGKASEWNGPSPRLWPRGGRRVPKLLRNLANCE
jgi:transposase-like protein